MSIFDRFWSRSQKLARSEEFPAVIDAVRDKLRGSSFDDEADRLHRLVHEMTWTTSNEFYAEVRFALREMRKGGEFSPDIATEIRRLLNSIDHICRWR